MLDDDDGDQAEDKSVVVQENLIRTKGKCKSHLRPKDIFLDLKQKTRRGKCVGAVNLEYSLTPPLMELPKDNNTPVTYNTIGGEIWYYIAEHIPPEDVGTFALICRHTANLVNTRKFWNHIYQHYCKRWFKENRWPLSLPTELQMDNIRCCDKVTLRARVIQSLFYCYSPFMERIRNVYPLDNLLGHIYLASWHEQQHCVWIMCYKFCSKSAMDRRRRLEEPQSNEDIDDWESLLDKKVWDQHSPANEVLYPHDGVTLLIICCDRFLPFPNQLLYGCSESRARLFATRQMLAKDMCGSNLELDFINVNSKTVTTVKYPKILSCKALPWWHPDFRKFIK